MYKLYAVILISAVCMSPVVAVGGAAANANANFMAAMAQANEVETLNPALIDFYGYQIGLPLLAPNVGPWTSLYAASLPPRSYVAQSNPVLSRQGYYDQFIGESRIGIVAI